jgi:N6-adenosine-specific RNA methylase IME4
VSRSVRQLVVSPIERHSKKPDCIRDLIVELCGDVPRIELFARETSPGWAALGNEIDGRDIRDAIKDVIRD